MSLACHHHQRFSSVCRSCQDNEREGVVLGERFEVEVASLRKKVIRYESTLEAIIETECDSYCWFTAQMVLEGFGIEALTTSEKYAAAHPQ